MAYRVEVAFSAAHELVVSFNSFLIRPRPMSMELDARWVESVGLQLPTLPKAFDPSMLLPLIHRCPDPVRFLPWLADLSPDQFQQELQVISQDGSDFRPALDPLVQALTAWNEHYFRKTDPALLEALAADAEAMRSLVPTTAPVDLIELATGGVEVAPAPGLDRVVLVPQYHFRPINLILHLPGWSFYAYPAEVARPEPGAPPLGLGRLTAALADTSRLRILRLLASRSLNFTEVQREMGLAKSTVHHHLVTLRVAGLIKVQELGEDGTRYTLRPAAIDLLSARLGAYLREG